MLPLSHSCKLGLAGTPLTAGPRSCHGRQAPISTQALFGKKTAKKEVKKEEKKEEKNWRGSVLSALDFAETRSQGDAKLLSSARGRKKGERLSEDEAKALRRKVGGTASNYFKEWVDVKGAYAEKGYVSKTELPAGLPFLLLVVLGLVGAAGYVVTQTNAPTASSDTSGATEQTRTYTREQREEFGLR